MGILARTPSIFARRLKRDGLKTTLLWLYGRGIPALTGAPMVKYSLVAPGVLVGPQHRQAGLRRLAAMGVRYCVNMRTEFDDAEHGLAPEHYCHLPTVDDEAPTLEQLRRGVEFVQAGSLRGRERVHTLRRRHRPGAHHGRRIFHQPGVHPGRGDRVDTRNAPIHPHHAAPARPAEAIRGVPTGRVGRRRPSVYSQGEWTCR